jgi:predicted Fe-Mo cluster-binding NifX family protein
MKIALPTQQNIVNSHFGHCEFFTVFTIDDQSKQITAQEKITSPEGCGCKSNIAHILSDMGVTVMLAGNMGDGAVNVLSSAGIKVLRGCSGDVKEVATNWLSGTLSDSGESCHAHNHDHSCQHH